jgi:hypothetical protein
MLYSMAMEQERCEGTGRRVYRQPKGTFYQSHICEVCGQSVYTAHAPGGFFHAWHPTIETRDRPIPERQS